MKLKLVLVALAVVAAIAALSAYVVLSVYPHLAAARHALSGDLSEMAKSDIDDALGHLEAARDVLDSPAARPLYLVPLLRQNLGALDAVVTEGMPAIRAGAELYRALDAVDGAQIARNGRIRDDLLVALREPLTAQAEALADLQTAAASHSSAWLLPPLADALEELRERTSALAATARRGRDGISAARTMLGYEGERTYLVLLVNNAELRGAGGILSGLGTISADEGKLDIGRFSHYFELVDPPYETVPAPEDFERRYSVYGANTTRLVNTTFSPDVPDVALVAARLFRAIGGADTDGVILIDPRGVAALLPPGSSVPLAETGVTLTPAELPRYVYSDAYAEFSLQDERYEALIELGRRAFEIVLDQGVAGRQTLEQLGTAIAGGHIRVVSFDDDEQALLEGLGASGDLSPPAADGLLVVMQNFGENKLDFWTQRKVSHSCVIEQGSARCSTSATFANVAPSRLPAYVTGNTDGLLKNLAEIYLPQRAELIGVDSSDRKAEFRRAEQDGYQVVASLLEIPRGEKTSMTATYELPLDRDRYSLVALPQALARDARIDIALALPEGWDVDASAGETDGSVFRYRSEFDRTITIEAGPSRARTGLSALWERVLRFWREPVF